MGPATARTPPGPTGSAASKIRMYRTLYKGMEELRGEIRTEHRREVRWKHRTIALGIVALVLGAGIVAAISVTQNTYYGVQGETNTYDTSIFSLTSLGNLVGLTTAAAGTTNSFAGAVDITLLGASGNTAITVGHWTYSAKISEAGVNTFAQSATAYYAAELFLDGVSQGIVYLKNSSGDAVSVESITIKWDIGTTLPTSAAYVVKVTQIAA